MDQIEEFFHFISPKIIALTGLNFKKTNKIIYKEKNTVNFATQADLDNEKLLTDEISKWFPQDNIVAEETLTDSTRINKNKCWILDPICGTANFNNGIKFFSTNIALALNGNLVASCVIDHSRGEYIWSVGNNILHLGNKIIKPDKRSEGVVIDVDLSAVMSQPNTITQRQIKLISYLLSNKKYCLVTYATSLGFAYTALNRINAYVCGFNRVWDVAAANFLVFQAGGIVTEIDGKPWTLNSQTTLAATDSNLHKVLLDVILS